uniref:Uncharacterized protein n=1 Tax=Arundo donax TaxID=35708 RepID=A0A0A9GKZ4_ARUDO
MKSGAIPSLVWE